jgi:choline dehydrogenase-like flavoprotein
MIRDLQAIENNTEFEADVCLVGAGAAGITLAHELSDSHLSVILLESGGISPQSDDQDLNVGEVTGLAFQGLTAGRARALGGTTKLWFGQCIRLDPIDFEQRSWVSHSGWPIHAGELEAWYRRAEELFRIHGQDYDERVYQRLGVPVPAWKSDQLRTHFTIYSPVLDFGRLYKRRFEKSERVQVLLHALATEIEAGESGLEVQAIKIVSTTGKRARVKAKTVVLCAGGIENARILLLSNHAKKRGLGNDQDLVGRFLQDHPNGFTANLKTTSVRLLNELFALHYRRGLRYFPKFPLGFAIQRSERTLNCTSHLVFEQPEESGLFSLRELHRAVRGRRFPRNLGRHVRNIATNLSEVGQAASRRFFLGKSPWGKSCRIRLQCHTEQQPDRDSRVSLSSDSDRFGLRKARVDWRVNSSERHTMRVMTNVVGQELKRLGLAEAEPEAWLDEPGSDWKRKVSDCFHHMGTTRMSDSPASGVVDRDCQLFGTRGLFVAGSSLFPTSGYANPTLTIVAMSMRLANHLKVTLGR